MQCNQCGQLIRRGQSGILKLQTGRSSDGRAYFRSVNLCTKCMEEKAATDQKNAKMKRLVVVLVILAAIGAGVYFYFNRP